MSKKDIKQLEDKLRRYKGIIEKTLELIEFIKIHCITDAEIIQSLENTVKNLKELIC